MNEPSGLDFATKTIQTSAVKCHGQAICGPDDSSCLSEEPKDMRLLVCCILFCWMGLFAGMGCKKSSDDGVASARSMATDQAANRMASVVPDATKPQPASLPVMNSVEPVLPSLFNRKAQALSPEMQRVVAAIGQALQEAQQVYATAFVDGKFRKWAAYYKADSLLSGAAKRFAGIQDKLTQLDPLVAKRMQSSLRQMAALMRKKASPQATAPQAYAILQAAFHAGPDQKNALLNDYRNAIQQVERTLLAEKVGGRYRVGISLMEPRPFVRLTKAFKRRDIRTTMRPPKGTAHTISVFLRHAQQGTPLAGTDVSVEIIGAKNGRQYSTQKLFLLWDGAPKYVGHLVLPRKDQPVFVQVTVSAFPLARTLYSQKMLRSSSSVRFAALVKRGVLSFSGNKPKPSAPAQGYDLMRAISFVGGQVKDVGPYRVGMALVPLQRLYAWDNGTLKQMWRSRRATCQLVVFIQDKRTGLLIPTGRMEAFIYWRNQKGHLFRTREILKPIYDGFPSYRVHLSVRPGTYDMRLRLDPPVLARFQYNVPATRTVSFQDIKHPALLKRFYRK